MGRPEPQFYDVHFLFRSCLISVEFERHRTPSDFWCRRGDQVHAGGGSPEARSTDAPSIPCELLLCADVAVISEQYCREIGFTSPDTAAIELCQAVQRQGGHSLSRGEHQTRPGPVMVVLWGAKGSWMVDTGTYNARELVWTSISYRPCPCLPTPMANTDIPSYHTTHPLIPHHPSLCAPLHSFI